MIFKRPNRTLHHGRASRLTEEGQLQRQIYYAGSHLGVASGDRRTDADVWVMISAFGA
jgi:hypothetical protein